MNLNQPVPELPVVDVEKAQEYYKKYFGCDIEWIYPGKEVGAVSSGDTAIFFRKRTAAFEPAVHWIYCFDVDDMYNELNARGANIVDDIEDKPWNIRQFTVVDLDGNVFYFHGQARAGRACAAPRWCELYLNCSFGVRVRGCCRLRAARLV